MYSFRGHIQKQPWVMHFSTGYIHNIQKLSVSCTLVEGKLKINTVSCTFPVGIFIKTLWQVFLRRKYSQTLFVLNSSRGNIHKHKVAFTPPVGLLKKTLMSHALFRGDIQKYS
jgi:hypothetical protein